MEVIKSLDYYLQKATHIHNNFYDYSKYVFLGTKVKSIIICPVHGEFFMNMNMHTHSKKPQGCPKCGREKSDRNRIKTQDYFISKCKEIHGDKYILDEVVYTKCRHYITPKCQKHGKWSLKAQDFVSGRGCPLCNESKGEMLICRILEEIGIEYKRQYKFDDCRGSKYSLPFDFYIPSKKVLIEYDGEYHFFPYRKMASQKAKENLIKIKWRDGVKDDYCKKNNMRLIRVSYTMAENEIRDLIMSICNVK